MTNTLDQRTLLVWAGLACLLVSCGGHSSRGRGSSQGDDDSSFDSDSISDSELDISADTQDTNDSERDVSDGGEDTLADVRVSNDGFGCTDPSECGIELSHVLTDGESGVRFVDNWLHFNAARPATEAEISEILALVEGVRVVDRLEREGAFGLYTIEIPPIEDLNDLADLARELTTHSLVQYASVALVDGPISDGNGPFTDTEVIAAGQGESIDKAYYGLHALQGAYEYLSAWREQEGALSPVNLSLIDSGVCASTEYVGNCGAEVSASVAGEFSGHLRSGSEWLQSFLEPDGPDADLPMGWVDRNQHLHGTKVAYLMGGASNGTHLIDSGDSPLALGNGVLGGAIGGPFMITSYLDIRENEYDWRVLPPERSYVLGALLNACGDVAFNSSWGVHRIRQLHSDTAEEITATWASAIAVVAAACRDTLYVFSAGNNAFPIEMTGTVDTHYELAVRDGLANVVVVAASDLGQENLSETTSRGDTVAVVASGSLTSWAAPIVTGTAGLLASIDPSLGPAGLVEAMTDPARRSDETEGHPFLDIAASVLLVAHDAATGPFVPFTTENLELDATTDLATLRGEEGYSGGTHDGFSKWSFIGTTLTVVAESTEETAFGQAPIPTVPEIPWTDASSNSRLRTEGTHHVELRLETDGTDSDRTIPVVAIRPTGEHTQTLTGQYGLHSGWEGAPLFHVGAYAYTLTLDFGEGGDENAVLTPLARNSETEETTVVYDVGSAVLEGCIVRQGLAEEVAITSVPIPDCGAGFFPAAEENFDEFNAFAAQVYNDGIVDVFAIPHRDTFLYQKVRVDFRSVQCELPLVGHFDGLSTGVEDVSVLGTYFQTYDVSHILGGAANCTATGTVILEEVAQTEFYFEDPAMSKTITVHGIGSTSLGNMDWRWDGREFAARDALAVWTEPVSWWYDTGSDVQQWFFDPWAEISLQLVPAELTHGGHVAPLPGAVLQPVQWAPGIGPVQQSDSADEGFEFEVTILQRPERTMLQ